MSRMEPTTCHFCQTRPGYYNAPHWTGSADFAEAMGEDHGALFLRVDVCREAACRDQVRDFPKRPRQPRKARQPRPLYGDFAQLAAFSGIAAGRAVRSGAGQLYEADLEDHLASGVAMALDDDRQAFEAIGRTLYAMPFLGGKIPGFGVPLAMQPGQLADLLETLRTELVRHGEQHAAMEAELNGYRRDVAALRRLLGTDPDA